MSLPGSDEPDRKTWSGWGQGKYNDTYKSYVPWLEDKYLAWFGENKTSYTAKEKLKTRVVPDENLGKVQDGVAEGVGGQFASGGLLDGVGDAASKEGVNRAERGETGLDEKEQAEGVGGKVQQGAEGVTGAVGKGVGGLAGGLTGQGGEKK